MNPARSMITVVRIAFAVAPISLAAGCSEELGPVPMPVTRVRGGITLGDRPVPGGWIEFTPVEGTLGNLRSARLGPDGRFEADGVAVGKNAIRLVNPRLGSDMLVKLFTAYSSPIRRVIAEHPSAELRIDLLEEAARFEVDRRKTLTIPPPIQGNGR